MKILNLTQHKATPDQIAVGVFEPDPEKKKEIQTLLTFDTLPSPVEIIARARALAVIAMTWPEDLDGVMVGGVPYLLDVLVPTLITAANQNKEEGRKHFPYPLHSFSERKSEDQPQADGTVKKVAVFEFKGFVPAVESMM